MGQADPVGIPRFPNFFTLMAFPIIILVVAAAVLAIVFMAWNQPR
jgi:hypothetical protein